MGRLQKLAGDTALYGLSSIIGRTLNYFLVPLYTSVFLPSAYGIVTELYAFMAFLNVIYLYGLEIAYFRYSTSTGHNGNQYFNLALSSILTTSIVFTSCIFLFSDSISEALNYKDQSSIINYVAVILAIDAIMAIPFARLRLEGKSLNFAKAKVINIFTNIFFNIFFLVLLPLWDKSIIDDENKVQYVFISNLIANALYFILLRYPLSTFKFRLSFERLKPMLIYALPLLLTGLAGVTNEMLSRALLKYLLPKGFYNDISNQAALGIFGACYKLSVLMNLGVQAFRYAAEPFFFSNAKDQQSPALFSMVMHWFIIFGSLLFLGVSVNLYWIAPIFLRNPLYLEGLDIVPYLLIGSLFLGIYYNLSVWYKLKDKTEYGAYIATFGALLTLILNIMLIPGFGYFGSALVPFIVYFLMSLINYSIGRKHLPIPYKVWKGLLIITLSIVLYLGVISIESYGLIKLLIRNLAVLFFIVLILIMEYKQIIRFNTIKNYLNT